MQVFLVHMCVWSEFSIRGNRFRSPAVQCSERVNDVHISWMSKCFRSVTWESACGFRKAHGCRRL